MEINFIRIHKNELTGPIYLNHKKEICREQSRFIPCDLAVLKKKLKEALHETKFNTCSSNGEDFTAVDILDFEIEYINTHISSEDHKEDIIEAYKNNVKGLREGKRSLAMEFYTDGSLRG